MGGLLNGWSPHYAIAFVLLGGLPGPGPLTAGSGAAGHRPRDASARDLVAVAFDDAQLEVGILLYAQDD